jgi:hypothetical protein
MAGRAINKLEMLSTSLDMTYLSDRAMSRVQPDSHTAGTTAFSITLRPGSTNPFGCLRVNQ